MNADLQMVHQPTIQCQLSLPSLEG